MELSDANFCFNYDGEDFTLSVGNQQLKGCIWSPQKEEHYAVIFVHDVGSFATQNHDVFDVINANGGKVYVCDHLGHGRSPGPRLGVTIENIVQEISALVYYVMQQNRSIPIFLYGQCAGALAIMSYILEKRQFSDFISGVLLESPWIVGWAQRNVGLFETTLLMIENAIMPNHIFDLQFTKYSTETSQLYIEKSEKCPLYFPYMTPKVYISAMKTITSVRSKCDAWPANIPVILAYGRDDTVLDADALCEFVNGIRRASKNFEVYNYSCGHLLTKGRERKNFLEDMVDFFSSLSKKK